MRYYLIAGEASGDLHGSNLMKGLLKSDPEAQFRFWGGDMMASVGGTCVRDYRETAVMGFMQVVAKAGKIFQNLSFCKKDILDYNPDVVILIDYPGFNFRIAEFAHKKGFKVFYYIAPKVWAWKEFRIKRIRRNVDKLFIIFPFEIDYFKSKGIDAIYEGNPLLDSIAESPAANESRLEFLQRNGLEEKPSIALLAGSRAGEVSKMMPLFRELEKRLDGSEYAGYQLLLAGAPSIDKPIYDKYLKDSRIKVIFGETYSIMRHSEAALVNSGTASLECALIGTPQAVFYKMDAFSGLIATSVLKIKYISLANIILDRPIFSELIQKECTSENMYRQICSLLGDSSRREKMKQDYYQLRSLLGGEGASARVAAKMIKYL